MKTQVHFDPLAGQDATFRFEIKESIVTIRGVKVTLAIPTWSSDASEYEYPDAEFGDPLVAAYNAYRRQVGIPSPEEMVALREKTGLSAKNFAKQLNIGEATVYRYEKGALPASAHQRIYKELATPEGFARFFGKPCDDPKDVVLTSASSAVWSAMGENLDYSTMVPAYSVQVELVPWLAGMSVNTKTTMSAANNKNVAGRIKAPKRSLALTA